jgi:hypothetical protein
MNGQPVLTDALVERMLADRAGDGAPMSLARAISGQAAVTPQVRRHWWARDVAPRSQSSALRLTWIVALVGLLLAAAVGTALVGSQLFKGSDDLSLLLPLPSMTSPPEVAEPSLRPVVTSSAFGPIAWQSVDVPNTWRLVGTPFGAVGAFDTGLRWLASDGTWPVLPLDGPDMFTRLFVVGADSDEPFWLRRSGSTWVVGEKIQHEGDLGINYVAAGPKGIVVIDEAEVQHSTDGIHFVRADRPPDEGRLTGRVAACAPSVSGSGPGEWQLGPAIATDEGFIVMSAAAAEDARTYPLCEPVLWFSPDGSNWDLVSPVSPFGPGSDVREVTTRDGRHVAIGQSGSRSEENPLGNAVWVSDDGFTWERLPQLQPVGSCPLPDDLICGHVLSRVAAGEPGWVILDYDGFAWTSTDGRTWEALVGWPSISGGWLEQGVAVSPGSIVVSYPGGVTAIGMFRP